VTAGVYTIPGILGWRPEQSKYLNFEQIKILPINCSVYTGKKPSCAADTREWYFLSTTDW